MHCLRAITYSSVVVLLVFVLKVRPLLWIHRFAATYKYQKLSFIETYVIYRRSTGPLFTVFFFSDFINMMEIFHSIHIKWR